MNTDIVLGLALVSSVLINLALIFALIHTHTVHSIKDLVGDVKGGAEDVEAATESGLKKLEALGDKIVEQIHTEKVGTAQVARLESAPISTGAKTVA